MRPDDKSKNGQGEEIDDLSQITRVRLPIPPETFGVLEQRLGSSRMRVRCLDGKTRICRIPGRLRRKLWVREGDILIAQPWEFGGEDKGDVLFKYKPIQVKWLKSKGYLQQLDDFTEF